MKNSRIICPDARLPREERIACVVKEFDKWISDPYFVELVQRFGGTMDASAPATDKIKWLKEDFVDIWDYRKRQKSALTKEGEAARWLLKNNEQVEAQKEFIYRTAERLGLIGTDTSVFACPDYYLPLGGARMSNLRRCEIAKNETERIRKPVSVVALAGMRPISESERNGYIDTYAPDAVTEYDAIIEGMKHAFAPLKQVKEQHVENENPNLSYDIREFENADRQELKFYTVAAPSTVPERRANSADCFKFFFETFDIPQYAKLVNCTSQIYCTYQQVRALFFAIDYGVEFDTIGFPFILNNVTIDENSHQLSEPVNYLQEMKATIDAMYDFVNQYVCSQEK